MHPVLRKSQHPVSNTDIENATITKSVRPTTKYYATKYCPAPPVVNNPGTTRRTGRRTRRKKSTPSSPRVKKPCCSPRVVPTATPVVPKQRPIPPSSAMLFGSPFKPPATTPMSPALAMLVSKAARYCLDHSRAPVLQLRERVPDMHSCHFAVAIAMAMEMAPMRVSPDFSAVDLFLVSKGSKTIDTPAARELFELLFVGLGCFPVGCDDLEWNEEPIVNINPRNLVVHVGHLPGDPTPTDPVSGKDRLLALASDEVRAKRYLGPFTVREAMERYREGGIIVSQAFIIAKLKAVSTAHRLVHNGSSKHGNINAATIDSYQVRLDHTSKFLELAREQMRLAAGAPLFQVVADVSKCYRRMGVRTSDTPRYGIRVDADKSSSVPFFDGDPSSGVSSKQVKKGQMLIYFDTCLPFGTSSSVSSCVRVTTYMRDVVRELLINRPGTAASYIDDFGIIGQKDTADFAIGLMRGLMKRVGLPENDAKMQLVSQLSVFLGIEYDWSVPSMSLPAKKQHAYLRHVSHFLSRGTPNIRVSELSSLVGKLAHCAQIFVQAKIFYQRLLAALRATSAKSLRGKAGKFVRLGPPELDDLRWWQVLLREHSGTVILDSEEWSPASTHKIYTDASSRTGYGVMWRGNYFHGRWDDATQAAIDVGRISINELELVCLTMALETFGRQLRGKRILFRCDNTSVVHNIASGSSQRLARAAILRRLYVVAAMYGIQLKSTWIPTNDNEHADALSRADFDRFFSLPQRFPLHQVQAPCLESLELLTNPLGPANPSSPDWRRSAHADSLR